MEINKINQDNVFKSIINIFNINDKDLIKISPNTLNCKFTYKGKEIKIGTYTDYDRSSDIYIDLEARIMNNQIESEVIHFAELLAYFNNELYSFMPTEGTLIRYLKMFKDYIDKDKIFYDYYSLDMSKRYFYFSGIIKEMPLKRYLNKLDEDAELKFGKEGKRYRNIIKKIAL